MLQQRKIPSVELTIALSAMEGERPQKLRKLNNFKRNIPFCSQRALSAILELVEKEGVPELHNEKQLKEASRAELAKMCHYGPIFEEKVAKTVDGGTTTLLFLNLLSYLAASFAQGGGFADLLERCHKSCPSSYAKPWHGIFYSDEVHPGNQLSSTTRKTWAVYFSFREFGQSTLSKEDAWITLMIKRSTEVSALEASIGQCFKLILEHMFTSEWGNPCHGVLLKQEDKSLKLYWTIGMFLQDGSAQKHTFGNKQDSGSRICLQCKNIFNCSATAEAGEEEGGTISSKFLTKASLDLASDKEVLDSWQRMKEREGKVSKEDWRKWQQAAGIKFSQQALLLSNSLLEQKLLQPCTQYTHDWMHGMCSQGVLCAIVFLLLKSLAEGALPNVWHLLHGYLEAWQYPASQKSTRAHRLFTQHAIAGHKAQTFKCQASEMLSLVRPLTYFVKTMVMPHGASGPQCQCFLAWAEVLEMLVALASLRPEPPTLLAKIEKALSLTVAAGWEDHMKPKFHWSLHYSSAYATHGMLPACWSLERKHKSIRKWGGNMCNTVAYERGLLEEVTCEHFATLVQPGTFESKVSLVKAHNATKKLRAFLEAENVISSGQTCLTSFACKLSSGAMPSKKDVVLHQPVLGSTLPFSAGEVQLFVQLDNTILALLEPLGFLSSCQRTRSVQWRRPKEGLYMLPAEAILAPVMWTASKAGVVTTLLPPNIVL